MAITWLGFELSIESQELKLRYSMLQYCMKDHHSTLCYSMAVWKRTVWYSKEEHSTVLCMIVHNIIWYGAVFVPVRYCVVHHLVGLVVKVSVSRTQDLGFESCLWRDFSRANHTSDFKIGTPVATLPGAWWCRVSTGTGWTSVNVLWLGEVESLICSFCLSVAACKIA